jgi:branched-chain amino acid transport system ATP-binding protein
MTTVLETEGLERRFGKLIAVDNVSLAFDDQDVTSIIGPNGAGKSTFYNLLTGRLKPTGGTVRMLPRDGDEFVDITGEEPYEINRIGLSRGFQINNVFNGLSVVDNLRIARISHNGRTRDVRTIAKQDTELTDEVMEIVDLVGLDDITETMCDNLSHGDKRKVEIALALGTDPSVVLLDEPTAGMNATETEKMVDLIRKLDQETDTTFVLTEHNMGVVLGISDRIIVLDNGQVIADGTPDEVMANEQVREAYLGGEA